LKHLKQIYEVWVAATKYQTSNVFLDTWPPFFLTFLRY